MFFKNGHTENVVDCGRSVVDKIECNVVDCGKYTFEAKINVNVVGKVTKKMRKFFIKKNVLPHTTNYYKGIVWIFSFNIVWYMALPHTTT
jgi:hypothetical protein